MLAVAIGVTTAFVVARDDPAQPAAAPTPTTIAAIEPADTNDRTDPAPTPTTRPPVRDEQAAKAAAVAFLRELGMRDPVAATYRRTGAATAEVGLHPKAGEGGRLFDKVTTLVQLHRYTNGWVPTGAKAADIEVAQPLPFSRILSPLTVSGLSLAYEGTVHVTVTEERRGADRVLGKGFVNGGGTELAPFLGAIDFARPVPGADAGWVVFSGDTAAGTGIIEATAVRVRFVNSDHRPQILGVSTNPPASGSA
ncbi:MAG TPA: Gmad2 immunoglobulin-like domain-containing protein, partial [Actinomycetes bacterium]|nr:Gmad2 immunoglobulin-like domain-containing protein [Actinomycetes bacterium]